MTVIATPANMKKYPSTPHRRVFAYSPLTCEEYSADAGDYWNWPEHHALKDMYGEDMVLVYRVSTVIDVDHHEGG